MLPTPAKGDKWGNNSHPSSATEYYVDDDEEEVLRKSEGSTGVIKINMPPPVREEPRYPQERWKTLIGESIAKLFINKNYLYVLVINVNFDTSSMQSAKTVVS